MQRADDVVDLGPRQRIEYALALTPGLDQAVGAQAGELLGNSWLTQAEHILDLAHRLFAVDQQTENQKPSLMGQSLEESAGFMGAFHHCVDVKMNFAR